MTALKQVWLCWLCLVANVGYATPIFLDFSAYPDGTPLSSVSFPGVTFQVPAGVNAVVRNIPGVQNGLWIKTSLPGPELTIRTSSPMTSSTFTANGYGMCQVPPGDSIKWFSGATEVDSFLTFVPFQGRCSSSTLTRNFSHDAIVFDVIDPNDMMVLDITLDFVPPLPQAIPTLSEWGMLVLATLMISGAFVARRRKCATVV